jgi:hypothetical protein
MDAVTPVSVVRVGKRQPPRVLVRFLDDSYEGHEEWVPPGRLQVLWTDVEAWQDMEDKWEAVVVPSEGVDGSAEFQAAVTFVDVVASPEVLEILWQGAAGVLLVRDPEQAAELLGTDAACFLSDRLAFSDNDGTVVVPWSTTLPLLRSAAPRFSDALLNQVDKEERRAAQRAIYGDHWGGRKVSDYTPPEICAEVDAQYAPGLQLLREWCGTEIVERHEELAALRAELLRVGELAERAISALEEAGLTKSAKPLRGELDLPNETLRAYRKGSH